jgi:hypothetical protein
MPAVILDFQAAHLARQQTVAENTLASAWSELWIHLLDLWEDICLDTLDLMHAPMTWDRVEIVEAEHSGRLIRELFEEG